MEWQQYESVIEKLRNARAEISFQRNLELNKTTIKIKPSANVKGAVKDLKYYLRLSYTIVLRPLSKKEGGGWFAEIPLLRGCWADGKSPDEAIAELFVAKKLWMESML